MHYTYVCIDIGVLLGITMDSQNTIRVELMKMTKELLVEEVIHLQQMREIYLTVINEMTMEGDEE